MAKTTGLTRTQGMARLPDRTNVFAAENSKQLQNAIGDLAIEVPPRGEGRTTADCEQWQIHRLLQALFVTGKLQPPVALRKGESPDFLLNHATELVGIETTEAINPDYVRATMHPNARNRGSVIDPSLYPWGTAGRPRGQIADEAGRLELTGDGWVGCGVEQEFVESVLDVVRKKTVKLRSHYERFHSDNLLIYQNQTLPCLDIDQARCGTAAALASYWAPLAFRTVYVDDGNRILEFTAANSQVL